MNYPIREPAAKAPVTPHEPGVGRDEGPSRRVCVGVVTGPQGIQGALRIKSFTEVPEDLARYGPLEDETGRRQFELHLCGVAKGVLIARVAGVENGDQAAALRGLRLCLVRSALPRRRAGEYYHADLIGSDSARGGGTRVGRWAALVTFRD